MASKGMTAAPLIGSEKAHSAGYFLTNVLHVSFAFFLVFTAFSGIQNLETSLVKVKDVGFISISVLYFVFMLACLGTPVIVSVLGSRWSIVVAFACFVLFCIANVLVANAPTNVALAWGSLVPTGALTGFAASFLWTAQGAYITANAVHYARARGDTDHTSSLGLFNGIFFCIFQLTQISGNLLESFVYKKNDKSSGMTLFIVYLVCAALGTLLSVLLRNVASTETPKAGGQRSHGDEEKADLLTAEHSTASLQLESGEEAPQGHNFRYMLSQTVTLWKSPRMLLLIPLMFVSGLEQGWIWGVYTHSFIKPSIGAENIGYVMACFGATDAIASVLLGKVSDLVGRGPVLVLGTLCQLGVSITLLIIDVPKDSWTLLILFAAIWGIGDATWNTQITAALGDFFRDNLEGAFANFKLFQSLMTAVAFLLGSFVHPTGHSMPKLYILIVLLVIGITCALINLAFFAPKPTKAKTDEDNNSSSQEA